MSTHHMSMTALSLALAIGAVVCFGAFKVYARWIDGKQSKPGNGGEHGND